MGIATFSNPAEATYNARFVGCERMESPQRIRGNVGECRFDLVWGAGRYTGGRTCGPRSETVSVLVPSALSSWSDPEVGSLLAIMTPRQ
jgi:hypothetical protein